MRNRLSALWQPLSLALAMAAAAGLTACAGEPAATVDDPAGPSAVSMSEAEVGALDSGRDIGEYVPTFYSRVVTGPLMNRSVCYVCRNGERPVVMVLLRKFDPRCRLLMKNIDRLVEQHRGSGLRSFGVMLSEDPFRSVSGVQTFSFNNRIVMPMTVAPDAVGASSCQNVHDDTAVTVVLYRRRRVEQRFAFREGEMGFDQVREVIEAVRDFASAGEKQVARHAAEAGDGVSVE